MINSLGQPDTVLLVGGASEIAVASALEWARSRRLRLILLARPGRHRDAAVEQLTRAGAEVEVVDFDARDTAGAASDLERIFDASEIDIAVVAHGVLPDQVALEDDPGRAADVCLVNYTSAVVVGLVLAHRMAEQRHGAIVAISSVAAVRARPDNYLYGSTKAGLDAFYTGLRERVRASGVRVLVVRPGFVRTRMTVGLDPAPFAVDAEDVARRIVARASSANGTTWVPAALGIGALAIRLAPRRLLARLAPPPPRAGLSGFSSDPVGKVGHQGTDQSDRRARP